MDFVAAVGRRSEVQVNESGPWVNLENRSFNGYERNVLYRNDSTAADANPAYTDHGFITGVDAIEDGRAVVSSDIDRDGDLDLIVWSFAKPVRLFVNHGEQLGNWLMIRLEGPTGNRDGIGAKITIESAGARLIREVGTTAGYLAGKSTLSHFGLGSSNRIERLVVDWPSGSQTVLQDVPVNRYLDLAAPSPSTLRPISLTEN